ncbi:universal stress protein [Alcaligenaceae bacterium]|nr:universal stress protein [Alcaligenaceae bacterium]
MFRRIALDLNKDNNQKRRLESAIQLAIRHQAELIGIYTDPLASQYLHDDVAVPVQLLDSMVNYIEIEKAETKAMFMKEAHAADLSAQWRAPKGSASDALALHARFCDLLVMSQASTPDHPGAVLPTPVESVITSAGRPVLIIPYVGELRPTTGRSVLFCWDYGRRAARALADAAPILRMATDLVVLTVDPKPEMLSFRDIAPDDLAGYCAAQGYPKIKEVHQGSEGVGVGNAILNTAADYGCDLIVMGAYSHSRVREWILGGASKTLLESMTVPILFSH